MEDIIKLRPHHLVLLFKEYQTRNPDKFPERDNAEYERTGPFSGLQKALKDMIKILDGLDDDQKEKLKNYFGVKIRYSICLRKRLEEVFLMKRRLILIGWRINIKMEAEYIPSN